MFFGHLFQLQISLKREGTFITNNSAKSEIHKAKSQENKVLNLDVNYGHKKNTEWTRNYCFSRKIH